MPSRLNVPTEVLRAVVVIAEKGSLTKAATHLGISQPAISAQIKRIESIVGGAVFQKTPNGSALTELGKLVVANANKILSANEQLLGLGGSKPNASVTRVGISSLIARQFLELATQRHLIEYQVQTDSSASIIQALLSGHLDIASVFLIGEAQHNLKPLIVEQTDHEMSWVRSRSFVLSPGAPLPIVTWTKQDWMTDALMRKGVPFKIVFNGEDYDAKKAAVECSLGISALPRMLIRQPLVEGKEYYLPKLPSIKNLICARPELAGERLKPFVEIMSDLFRQDNLVE